MTWTCRYGTPLLIDEGKFYTSLGSDPTLTGSFFMPPDSATATQSATATLSPSTITFAQVSGTPLDASLLLLDPTSPTSGGGDFFRWAQNPFPASPATLSSITVPSVSITIGDLQSQVDAKALAPMILGNLSRLGGSLTLSSVTLQTAPPNLTFMALGSISASVFGNRIASISFNLSGTLAIRPSHDRVNMVRVLAVSASSPKLVVFGFEPNFLADASLKQVTADAVAGQLESNLNSNIRDTVTTQLRRNGMALAGDTVISAQRVVIAKEGMTLAFVLGNINGPVLQQLPTEISIQVTVTPSPLGRAGKPTQYTVLVTDRAGNAVIAAHVRLDNVDASRRPQPQSGPTGTDGKFLTDPHTSLHDLVVPHLGTDKPPSVTVEATSQTTTAAAGPVTFATVTVTLDLGGP